MLYQYMKLTVLLGNKSEIPANIEFFIERLYLPVFFITKDIKMRASFHKSLESIDKNEKELYTEYV